MDECLIVPFPNIIVSYHARKNENKNSDATQKSEQLIRGTFSAILFNRTIDSSADGVVLGT